MKLVFSEGFFEDMARIQQHLRLHGADVSTRITVIFESLTILGHSPCIGRLCEHGLRELVIGTRGRHRGFVALYDARSPLGADPAADGGEDPDGGLVLILAIRSQQEAGYH